MPQAWKDSLAAAVAAGRIPNFPPSTVDPNNGPVYSSDVNPNDVKSVCSATYKCRLPEQIWDAPEGVLGVSFDDGPLPVSPSSSDRCGTWSVLN
jgi:chitin deacetylase